MTINEKWIEFKNDVYPKGFVNDVQAGEIERAFHGGVLIGLVLVVDGAVNIRQELDKWNEDEKARRQRS